MPEYGYNEPDVDAYYSSPGREPKRVILAMDDQEAHDVHHALAVAITLLREVAPQPGAPLTTASKGRLERVTRRLDHDRRWKGGRPNPHA